MSHHACPSFAPLHIPWIFPTFTYPGFPPPLHFLELPHHIFPGFSPPSHILDFPHLYISWTSPTPYTLDFHHLYIPWIFPTFTFPGGTPAQHIPWIFPTFTYPGLPPPLNILDFPHHIYPGFPPPHISWISPTYHILESYLQVKKKQISLDNKYNSIFSPI